MVWRFFASLIALAVVAAIALTAWIAFAAPAVRVIDGDGLFLGSREIRLWGIDAPEMDQECEKSGRAYGCGYAARSALRAFTEASGGIECQHLYFDKDGRSVARCAANGKDLAGMMVRSGWALDWPRFSKGAYAADQSAAQSAERGMWAGSFVKPWVWRRYEHGPR